MKVSIAPNANTRHKLKAGAINHQTTKQLHHHSNNHHKSSLASHHEPALAMMAGREICISTLSNTRPPNNMPTSVHLPPYMALHQMICTNKECTDNSFYKNSKTDGMQPKTSQEMANNIVKGWYSLLTYICSCTKLKN